ncbi:MAG: ABC transporter substrate-binding protein, partial [Sedimentibacter sp.]
MKFKKSLTKLSKNYNKYIALFLVITLTATTFSGCSSNTKTESPESNTSEPKTSLVYGIGAEPSSLDPMTFAMMSSFTVTYAIYDTLVQLQDDGTYSPSLAEDVIISDDGLEYTIPIKKGVKFHDGSELTAEDVRYSLERTIAKGWAADMTAFIESVSLADADTVKIVLNKPFGGMVGSLASPFFSIMSKNYVETKGDDAIKREPMGTGSYKMTEWVIGDHITLEANEDYFQGAPSIKTITIRPITDKNTGLIALENKEIDAYLNVNPSDISTIKENKDLAFYSTDQAAVLTLNMNIEKTPLDNVKVRQAISYAINKDDIIAGALEGVGTPANSPIPTLVDGYSADISYYEHNVEKAKELLKEAGVPELNLTLKIKEDAKNQKVAQIVQANLKEAGINVEIEVMEAGAFSTDIYSNGDYELTIGSWSAMFLDAYSVVYSQ